MDKLTLALNGIAVGILEKGGSGEMSFIYHQSWLDRPGARTISLSLPLQADKFRGAEVYNFFDNLLPPPKSPLVGTSGRSYLENSTSSSLKVTS